MLPRTFRVRVLSFLELKLLPRLRRGRRSSYNRNATIAKNDVSWNGDTAFAAWGITGKCINEKCDKKLDWPVGPDGRNGEQPRGTRVIGNMVRELGIWQKQSSMWFQAVTAQTHLAGNVHFNGKSGGIQHLFRFP